MWKTCYFFLDPCFQGVENLKDHRQKKGNVFHSKTCDEFRHIFITPKSHLFNVQNSVTKHAGHPESKHLTNLTLLIFHTAHPPQILLLI